MLKSLVISLLVLLVIVGCGKVTEEVDVNAPVNLQIEKLSEGRIALTWDYLHQTTGIHYIIARKAGENDWELDYGQSTEKTFIDDIHTNSYTVYSYKVKSAANEEETESFYSETEAYFSPLTKASDLSLVQSGNNEITLSWSDNAEGEFGYKIDRKIGDNNWVVSYAMLAENSSSFVDNFSELFVDISYRVYPYAGNSIAEKTELSYNPTFPTPENLLLTQLSQNEIQLSWTYNEEDTNLIEGFQIARKIGSSDWSLLKTTLNSVRNIIDILPYESGTLAYRIRAYKQDQFSAFTEPVTLNLNINFVSELSLSEKGNDIAVKNNFVFVANNYNGISVINTGNQNNPVTISNLPLPGKTISLCIDGNILYAGSSDGLISFINISDPSSIYEIDSVETLDMPNGTVVAEVNSIKYLFAADGIAGLLVIAIDGNDPTNPKIIGRHNTHGISHALLFENNYIYLADGYGGVKKIDVSNPAEPQKTLENTFLSNVVGIKLLNNNLYLASADKGMQIISKNNLQLTAYYDTPGYVADLTLSNRYAYIADKNMGIYIVSIVHDTYLHSIAYISNEDKFINGIELSNQYLYLVSDDNFEIYQVKP